MALNLIHLRNGTENIPQDKVIMQSNALTSARFEYTACQLDILFMIMATLEKGDLPNKKYIIYLKEIEALTGREWNYQQLRESTEQLGSRMFEVNTKDKHTQFWLFQHFEYKMGEGCFEVMLGEKAHSMLFDLKNTFTVMQLKAALACTSKFSKRLYTIACQWRNVKAGEKIFEIAELKEMLMLKDPKGVKKEQFKRTNDFEKHVLETAKTQINEHTDINFDYKIIKIGRKAQRVKLIIKTQNRIQMDIDFTDPSKIVAAASLEKRKVKIESWGFKGRAAEALLNIDFQQLLELSYEIDKLADAGKVKNAAAYFWGVLQKKGLVEQKVPK